MRDVQSERDPRNVPLDYVGIENVRLPITVRTKEGGKQPTVGTFSIGVDFPHSFSWNAHVAVHGSAVPTFGRDFSNTP